MAIISEGDFLGLVGVYGYVAFVVAISWFLRKRVNNTRKIVHVLVGGIVFFWWLFESKEVMTFLAAMPFVPVLMLATPRSPVGFLKRSPLGARSSEGHHYGLVLYAISWTVISYTLFEDLFAASIAIAAMSFGDGMGELIGRRYGKMSYLPHRTIEGTAAVFGATLVAVFVLAWFYFDLLGYRGGTLPELLALFAVGVSGLTAMLEAVTPGSVDNLVIPLVLGGFLHALGV